MPIFAFPKNVVSNQYEDPITVFSMNSSMRQTHRQKLCTNNMTSSGNCDKAANMSFQKIIKAKDLIAGSQAFVLDIPSISLASSLTDSDTDLMTQAVQLNGGALFAEYFHSCSKDSETTQFLDFFKSIKTISSSLH